MGTGDSSVLGSARGNNALPSGPPNPPTPGPAAADGPAAAAVAKPTADGASLISSWATASAYSARAVGAGSPKDGIA